MNNLALAGLLRRRYPGLEIIYAEVHRRYNGEIYQSVHFKGTKAQLLISCLATERMFANTHWRKRITQWGCSYRLDDYHDGKWVLCINSEMTPTDGHGEVSFLSKKGLKETEALLHRIFTTSRTGAAQ